jgi:hypothetical protein
LPGNIAFDQRYRYEGALVMADKSPQEELAETNARLAISQKYLARDDNPDLDPFRQDQLDRNRILGQFGSEQLSPKSELRNLEPAKTETREGLQSSKPGVGGNISEALTRSLREQPYVTLGLAVLTAFALGAIWKA